MFGPDSRAEIFRDEDVPGCVDRHVKRSSEVGVGRGDVISVVARPSVTRHGRDQPAHRIDSAHIPRPYRAVGYPVLPALYITLCIGVMILLLLSPTTRTESISGLVLVLIGVPVFYLWRSAERPSAAMMS